MALSFGAWAPLCGDWLRVRDPQPTPSPAQVLDLARRADRLGYDVFYVPENYLNAVHGASAPVLDPWVLSGAAVLATQRLRVFTACQPGTKSPLAVAKMGATLAISRPHCFGLSCVAGWWPLEAETYGESFLDHAQRYARLGEFVDVLRGLWSEPRFDYPGRYYTCRGAELAPKPSTLPPVIVAGESEAALELAARAGDYLFINGGDITHVSGVAEKLRSRARYYQRTVKLASSALVVLRPEQEQAETAVRELVARANLDTIRYFDASIDGAVVGHNRGALADKIEANLGLSAGLVGSPDTILRQLRKLEQAGVELVITKFDNILGGLEEFAESVVSVYRNTERGLGRNPGHSLGSANLRD